MNTVETIYRRVTSYEAYHLSLALYFRLDAVVSRFGSTTSGHQVNSVLKLTMCYGWLILQVFNVHSLLSALLGDDINACLFHD
jgi:hypothetical protein